jgi:hypothetical protein
MSRALHKDQEAVAKLPRGSANFLHQEAMPKELVDELWSLIEFVNLSGDDFAQAQCLP